MKKIILGCIFIFLNVFSLNASDVFYDGKKVGEIENLDTLKDGYIKAKITHPLVKFFTFGKEYGVFTNNYSMIDKKSDTIFFKKDKNNLIQILNYVLNENWEDHKEFKIKENVLVVDCNTEKLRCDFNYYDKDKEIKNTGHVIITEKKELKEFVELKKNILFTAMSKISRR